MLPIGWRNNHEQSAVQQSNVASGRKPPESAYPFGRPLPREAISLDRLMMRAQRTDRTCRRRVPCVSVPLKSLQP